MTDHVLRYFQTEAIPRFQQTAIALLFRFHQTLPDRTICGLTEITALRMFQMRTADQQLNPHIGDRRAGKHTQMFTFLTMLQNQSLPVTVKHVLAAHGRIPHATSSRQRLKQHMGLRIVT